MNKGIIIAGIIILVLVGGGLYITNQQSQKAEEAKTEQEKAALKAQEDAAMKEKQDKDAMMKKDDDKMTTDKNASARYVAYSKAIFDQTADKRRVLYFYANWCPICRPTDANFKENVSKIPEDVVVIRVNYNDTDTDQEEKDLAKKYVIPYQHTFVQIDANGNPVTKWNGGKIDELLANIK